LPSKRYSFLVNVQMPFPFHVVRRAYGSNKGTRSFAFRVDPDSATNSTRIMQESVRITSELPECHTREQRRRVAEAMSGGGGKQRSTVLDLYRAQTVEESYVPAKKEFVDDLTRAIDERVSMEQVVMTVQENGRHRGGKFTDFFRVAKVICSTRQH
jgi:Arc/MetJ family transcription regulator